MTSSRPSSTERENRSTSTDERERSEPSEEMTAVTRERIVAQTIDLVVLTVQFIAVFFVFRSVLGPEEGHHLFLYSSLTLPLYGGFLEGFWHGQTIGKQQLRIAVTDGTGAPSFFQAFVRNVPAVFLFGVGFSNEFMIGGSVVPLLVGLAVIAVSDRRQRLLDHVLGTYVVAVDESVLDSEPRTLTLDQFRPGGEYGQAWNRR